ncbi:NUDIX hydrolase [Paenibacillus lycopersici]|uniref:NUDIX hydrolase n=1 Tax=Paenibacillus lycopersici TaxID=2704462 RepID=A0A6C0FXT9_9BACL|nr:NUDIX hydrolase [Paenibacillus lycopersici]QHT61908.1 NUDIX hydrolase [Paenibacillus lycopersici]
MAEQFYRHMGVYGICVMDKKLLVIRKRLGPYTGRFDLPGGRPEPSESLEQAMMREMREETGYVVQTLASIGVCDFDVKWMRQDGATETVHHIAILYEASIDPAEAAGTVEPFEGQDSSGAEWLPIHEAASAACSPLVRQAIAWLSTKTIPVRRASFDYRG